MKGRKGVIRLLTLFLVAVLFQAGAVSTVSAAKKVKAPAKVQVSYVLLSDTSVRVRWTGSNGAAGYTVVEKATENGKTKSKEIGTGKTYVNRTITPGVKYTYQVRAYAKNGSKKVYSAKSNVITVYVPITAPQVIVSGFDTNAATIKWTAVDNALRYRVYLYDPQSASKKYEVYGDTKGLKATIKGLKTGITYRVVVRAVFKDGNGTRLGGNSNIATVTLSKVLIPTVHGRYYAATVKKNTTAVDASTGERVVLKKGLKIICSSTTGTVNARLTSNADNSTARLVKVSAKALKFTGLAVTSSKYKYTKQQKESFINSTGLSSSTNYLIWVNQFTCEVTIFRGSIGKWQQIRTMSCVVGRGGATGTGKRKILKKGTSSTGTTIWFTWNASLNGGNAFHGYVDSRKRGAYSHGCVRLPSSGVSFIYKEIPIGTTVYLY